MRRVCCFVTSAVTTPIFSTGRVTNVEELTSRRQSTHITVRRTTSLCEKLSNSEKPVTRQHDKTDELATTQGFLEAKSKTKELQSAEFAFILTSFATAVAGGPAITAWSALYFLLGRESDVPLWLCSLASLLCSALTDAFIWNFSDSHQGTGVIPYLLYALGTAVFAIVDFDQFFRIAIPSRLQNQKLMRSDRNSRSEHPEQSLPAATDLNAWDRAFKEQQKDQE